MMHGLALQPEPCSQPDDEGEGGSSCMPSTGRWRTGACSSLVKTSQPTFMRTLPLPAGNLSQHCDSTMPSSKLTNFSSNSRTRRCNRKAQMWFQLEHTRLPADL